MQQTSAQLSELAHTTGSFKYLDGTVQPSLYRNGEVLTRRDPDGSDGGSRGINLEPRAMPVYDARRMPGPARRTLAAHGFELLAQPLQQSNLDFLDHRQVVGAYYEECAQVVASFTGARAFAFDHNVRSASGKQSRQRIAGGQQVQGPAHVVHGDYTLTSAPQRVRDLARPPRGNDTLRSVLAADQSLITPAVAAHVLAENSRFAIVNLWRNIAKEPVAAYPMALCDGQTVDPQDLVVFEIHYENRVGENYFARHSPRHAWYYYPAMTGDEALLIKQWDSAGTLARTAGAAGDGSNLQAPCTFSFHSAFEDPDTLPNAPDRWSVEVRCLVLYD